MEFDETLLEYSLNGLLSIFFSNNLITWITGCHGNQSETLLTSFLELLIQFQITFTEWSLTGPLPKLFKRLMICQHTWPPGAGQFSLHGYKEYIDFFFSKTAFPISNYFYRNYPWVDLYQRCSKNDHMSKTWPPGLEPVFLMAICVNDWRKGAYGTENSIDSDQPPRWKRGVWS
jgi:hypothetical protein